MDRIVIAGAGAIGCYVGGCLAEAGHRVTFLARPRVAGELAQQGLRVTDYAGLDVHLEAGRLDISTEPACLTGAGLVLVCVKSHATEEMAREIAAHAPEGAAVVSLQNGVSNARVLAAALPGRDIRPGMVLFNVIPKAPGHVHRASSGAIVIGPGAAGAPDLAARLSTETLRVTQSARIEAIQWGKLLLNLNNAINALSGRTLLEMMLDRGYRRVMADQNAEALRVLKAADVEVEAATPAPAWAFPHILRLPTPLFRRVAARMLTFDPSARGSMSFDLAQGRRTEIDALQGEILRLAAETGVAAPLNAHVAALVKRAEEQGERRPEMAPEALRVG